MKRVFLVFALILTIVLCLALVACNNAPQQQKGSNGYTLDFNTVYAMAEEVGYTGTLDELVEMFKGDNAYQLAVAAGYTGTQEQWLMSLVGAAGKDGATPTIGSNKHWYIAGVDTGVCAEGKDGADGRGIDRIEKTATEGLVDTYTIYFTDGTTSTYQLTNGKQNATHIHNAEIETIVIQEPTCKQKGIGARVCSECKEILSQFVLDETPHAYIKTVYPATCTSDGREVYVCKECGDSYSVTLESAFGHSYSDEYSFDSEYHWKEALCGHSYAVVRSPHVFDENNTCRVCGLVFIPYITAEELGENEADVNLLLIYADQYLTNNAIDSVDNTTGLQVALQAQADRMKGDIKKITAKLEADGCYSLTFTFANKKSYSYHAEGELVARAAEPGVYAGYEVGTGTAAFESSLAEVYNAFLRTVQKALEEGEAFGNDYKESAINGEKTRTGYTFGGSVEGAFTFNYGVGENQIGPMSYGLKVYGTLGYLAQDTEVAIEVIDELADDILVGLYYKDATLFLSLNFGEYEQKVYLDNADINAIVGAILGDVFADECEHAYEDGYCTKCGKVQPEEAEGEPFYMHAPNYTKISAALTDLTNGNSMVGTIVKIVDPLLTSRSTAITGGTRYQYQIDVDAVFKKLLGNPVLGPIIAGAANPIIESIFPNLDLDSFQGIGGTLTLSFDVMGTKNATLGGVQVAYNVAQKDFRWNKNDDEKKLYGPVNAAITISDFAIGDYGVEAAKVNKSKYTYFSPMNGEITADITYTDKVDAESELNGDYKLIARAEFNPFTLFAGDETRDGAAEIILNKANGDAFAHVYIHDFTCVEGAWDSTVTVYYDGTYYETKASQSDFFQKTFAEFILPLVARDTDSNLAPISDYVWELIDQFHKDYTAADLAADVAAAKEEINKLEVTKHAYRITLDRDGHEIKEDLGVMPSSYWLDAIKANAIADIYAAVAEVADTDEARKAAKKDVEKIVSQAKSDYNAQLKLEGKNDSLFEGFNLIALFANINDLIELFVTDGEPTDPSVFNYNLDLSNPQLHLDLDYNVYNKVIKVLQAAIPKLEEFDRDATTVKVEMNTRGYEGLTWISINSNGLGIEIETDMISRIGTDMLMGQQDSIFSCYALVRVTKEDVTHAFYLKIDANHMYQNGGTITVSLKESDGVGVTAANDEFVRMVITQDWDGEEYVGFNVELTLRSRNPETGALNEAHVYNISGKHEEGMYVLDIEECDITLGIGNFAWGFDNRSTLSFGIPAPWCNISFRFGGAIKDVQLDVTNLKIAKWGTDDVEIEGIDTTGKEVVRNTVDVKAMDNTLFDVVVDRLEGFFYDFR